jgi:phosphoglycerol transferase MdoB-like AlkP superfamily enzyme
MATQQSAASGGIGLGGAVFLVFLVLKLTGHIDWSWWWVTSPLWGVFALVFGVFGVVMLLAVLASAVGALLGGKRSRR